MEARNRSLAIRAFDFAKWRMINAWEYTRNASLYDRREPNHVWEAHVLKRMFQSLPIDCVFDVGANRGGYANMLRRDVGYHGLIISFEPIPELAHQMRRDARRDPNWIIEEVALSATDGTDTFHIMANHEFSSLSAPSNTETKDFAAVNRVMRSIPVKTERLDTALERIRQKHKFKTPFLKLDTQGNDANIVSAAVELARQFVALQSELSFLPIYANSHSFEAALEIYKKAGFALSAMIPNNAGHFPRLVECDCLMVQQSVVTDADRAVRVQ